MQKKSPFTPAERLESLKVATTGGVVAGVVSLGILWGYRWFNADVALTFPNFWTGLAGLTLLANWAIATASGGLFALTYRYAIRQDHNLQLNAGVVLAFTLVRGLAQVDAGSAIARHFWPFLTACGESLLIFGSTAIVLTLGFRQQWLKPFGD